MRLTKLLLIVMLGAGMAQGQTSAAKEGEAITEPGCTASAAPLRAPFSQPYWNGWGVSVAQSRFQPAAMAQLNASQVSRLKLKWAFGFPGATQASAQPTVVGGRVFVGSTARKVYALDAETGCQRWVFTTDFAVRTAVTVGGDERGWFAYFGDRGGYAYALNADTGALRWKIRVDDHRAAMITGSPTLAGGTLYVPMSSYEEAIGADVDYQCCTFRGSLAAINAGSGRLLWKSFTIPDSPQAVGRNKKGVQRWGPSGAAVWSSPTVDLKAGAVYVTTGDSYSDPPAATSDAFIAFDIATGRMLWSRQVTEGDAFTIDCDSPPQARTNCPAANGPDFDFGSSPILVELSDGRRALIAGQKSGIVHAVDPDRQGAVLWQTRVGKGGRLGGVQWGSAADQSRVYVAVSDAQVRPAAPGTPGAQATLLGISLLLDPNVGGGLVALTLDSGEIAWRTPHPGCHEKPGCSQAQSAAVTAIPGVVFSGGLDGHLRAYAAGDGRILWDIDTEISYQTVNGVTASGGSLDGPGAVVVEGTVFVNSGYAYVGSAPGNVLLAFSVDGR